MDLSEGRRLSQEGAVGGDERDQLKVEQDLTARDKVELLEREVEELRLLVQNTFEGRRRRDDEPTLVGPVKTLLKPRDIPIMELSQLKGVEGAGRLAVFLSQVESCSSDAEERQQIVQMRADAPLALFIQSIRSERQMSWTQFKEQLTAELTNQSEEKIYDSLNDLKYSCDQDPTTFMTELKCKLAALAVQTKSRGMPCLDKLVKTKLMKGMPKASRDRLELYMDENISLQIFLRKLETERLVVMAQHEDSVRVVEPPVRPTQGVVTPNPPMRTTREGALADPERRYSQGSRREKYCPYCRARSHSVAECRKQPRPGSCYDCLQFNCYRGHPSCPGRINVMRGRRK